MLCDSGSFSQKERAFRGQMKIEKKEIKQFPPLSP